MLSSNAKTSLNDAGYNHIRRDQESYVMTLTYPILVLMSALLATIILLIMHLELALAIAGIASLILLFSQLLFKDRLKFWFVIFIFTIPLAAGKIFGDKEALLSTLSEVGLPSGALPTLFIYLNDIFLFMLLLTLAIRFAQKKEKPYIPKHRDLRG